MKKNIEKIRETDPVAGEIIDLLGKVFPGCGGFYIPPRKVKRKRIKRGKK